MKPSIARILAKLITSSALKSATQPKSIVGTLPLPDELKNNQK
ncbi:hypothetical protein PVOR_23094 [Paenibacillus vortex V453]|uniref:Uncharacterized protein n=1 Tax=Paenibacillus vortex V453 TaxID=715225 RepID=A0A2R9SS50_9BACL|nr:MULTISPECIES: hypothetical protein [Paenibacillus]EFU40188.1 hypothetical protein PVOR_23094 [Paenibacillus vortex V453]MDH6669578.1 hypothetical protein [Paenibacillus sp. LBL]